MVAFLGLVTLGGPAAVVVAHGGVAPLGLVNHFFGKLVDYLLGKAHGNAGVTAGFSVFGEFYCLVLAVVVALALRDFYQGIVVILVGEILFKGRLLLPLGFGHGR